MSEILVSDIVSGTTNGDAIFDKLMEAITVRLEEQYKLQRISGPDYATVYLGALQGALQQSIAFALGKEQADKQADLTVEQTALIVEQVAEVTAGTIRNDDLASSTKLKIDSETSLLTQKKFTEEAQTIDNVNGNPVVGLVGKQKELYTNQSQGFIRDAEQKAVKGFVDIWSIAKSTDPNASGLALPLNADQGSMDVMLAKLAEGIGVLQTDLGTPAAST